MKKTLYFLMAAVMLSSMVLTACGGQATPTVVEETEPEVEVEEPTEAPEPTAEPTDVVPAGPEALDEAYDAMLAGMERYNTISADGLLQEMTSDSPPFILDVRTTEEVEEGGYIEGATHIPLSELAQHPELLPDFDTPIVTYCAGGWRATIAMTTLYTMGWNDVRALKARFADWKEAGNPVVEGMPENPEMNAVQPDESLLLSADAYLQNIKDMGYGGITAENLNTALGEQDELVLIDVRRQEELDEKGKIDAPNLIHIPLEEFIARRSDWPGDKDTSIAVYCGSGHRSTMAMTILLAYGYSDVVSLKGGFSAWKEAGYATVGGAPSISLDDTYSAMLSDMQKYNTISADDLLVEMTEDQPPFLLDVRRTEEVEESGHIEGAYHIPLSELAQNIDKLPAADTPIVTYCAGGWRATIAMTALHAMGWTEVRALKARFADWKDAGNPVVEGLPEEMVFDVASPASGLVESVDAALSGIQDMGYGVKKADALNTELIDSPDLILIDVRRQEELEEKGVIAVEEQELLTIPLEEFLSQKDAWPAEKGAEIVVYCGSGHRSTMAMTILLTYGYEEVSSLSGGFSSWAEAGYPVAEYAAP